MRYSGYYKCKFCGKTWRHRSNWIPFELVDWIYSILFLFHLIFHHLKELIFKNIVKGLWQVLRQFLCAVLFLIFTMVRIILYPFKLLVDLFYWGTFVSLLFCPGILLPGRVKFSLTIIISFHKSNVKSNFTFAI